MIWVFVIVFVCVISEYRKTENLSLISIHTHLLQHVRTCNKAERQKKFTERESRSLKHRLAVTKGDVDRANRNRLHENSNLLYECNDLRRNMKALEKQLEVKE